MDSEFLELADPYRKELLAHCYRMLSSVHDAEDLVQETLLRAWRAYGDFEGRSSLRTWLYRIATNACLRALENRQRRAMPSGLGAPATDYEPRTRGEVPWIEPLPDLMFVEQPADPEAATLARENTRLAFIAALQHLPARQRAVLLLADVLQWKASEVADALSMTTAAVNSALQRARAQLRTLDLEPEAVAAPVSRDQQALLDRYVEAFERADISLLTSLLNEDIVVEMPPYLEYYAGLSDVTKFYATRFSDLGALRLLPTLANGQPAFGVYVRKEDLLYEGHSVHVLTVADHGVSRIASFLYTDLLPYFGLPTTLSS